MRQWLSFSGADLSWCGGGGHLRRDCPSFARTYAAVAGGSETHKLRPLEEVLQEVCEAKRGLGTGAAVLAAEVAVASPVKEGLMTEGDVPGRRDAEGGADSSNVGVDREGVGAGLSLGDSLPLVGSWADCALQYDQVQATFEEKAELEPFSRFRVVPLCQRNLKIVTVQVYNPYVGDEAVAEFLRRYGQVDTQTKYLRDSFGIWTGRRQFRVLLGEDPDSADGLRHPPAYFSIGADRGFLFYSGQPVFCRQCRSFGHLATGCVQVRCRNCGGTGHNAASCEAQRTCHGCGGGGHLRRDCPSFARTYAAVAGGSETHKLRPLEEVLQEVCEAKRGLGTGAAVLAAEVAVASPVKEGLMTEGDVPGRRDAEGGADSSNVGVDREGVGAGLSLGDSLPLVGSWADCAVSSEEGDMADTVVSATGGVRRPRYSSGGDLTESSAEVVPAESRVKGRRRRKKQREGTVQMMDHACDEERPSTSSGHSGVLDVDSGQEDSGSGSDVREGVPAPPPGGIMGWTRSRKGRADPPLTP
ncbi:hypothetical protein D5F01_LYC05645 [Larimichthys crocea]|uniref:CCHC-type domain-containing protein n=1 Tax=Larimichthys crocea TaxID=215358 RepID=A0A6G0IZC6_LARCR|nr:hypothetical protein D5F01_LYC05645 [Larimichthys crocea]